MPNTQPVNLFVKGIKQKGEKKKHLTRVYQMRLQNNQANQNTQIQKISLQGGGGGRGVSKEDLIHNCSEAMQVKLLLL